MGNPEALLQEAVRFHQTSEFKKGLKTAEKARKEFLKDKNPSRAIEALRVMGDCAINAREFKQAQKLYDELMSEAVSTSNLFYQAAACWGLGQLSSHKMQYQDARDSFETGLKIARKIADKWYTGWNAFGMGNASRGMGNLDEAKPLYNEAIQAFQSMNQSNLVIWVERALNDIGGELSGSAEAKVWLCPMCGSKFSVNQVEVLKRGKSVSCEYCGTTVG